MKTLKIVSEILKEAGYAGTTEVVKQLIDDEFSSLLSADNYEDLEKEVAHLLEDLTDRAELGDITKYSKEITKAISNTAKVYHTTLMNELRKIKLG